MWGEILERSVGLILKQKGKGVGKRIEYSVGLRKFGLVVGSSFALDRSGQVFITVMFCIGWKYFKKRVGYSRYCKRFEGVVVGGMFLLISYFVDDIFEQKFEQYIFMVLEVII